MFWLLRKGIPLRDFARYAKKWGADSTLLWRIFQSVPDGPDGSRYVLESKNGWLKLKKSQSAFGELADFIVGRR